MTDPFVCKDTFLIAFEMSRKRELPQESILQLEAQFKVITQNYPNQFEVYIRLRSAEPSPFKFKTELVGQFGYVGDNSKRDKNKIKSFLSNSGIPIIWSTFLPVLRMMASTMGIYGINLPLNSTFNIELLEQKPEPTAKLEETE